MKIFKRNKKRQRLILKANADLKQEVLDRLEAKLSANEIDAVVIPKGFDVVAFDGGSTCSEIKKF
ncbi:MAG: hypothetical protein ACLRZT_08945 [Clostridium paraputrificum]